MKGSLLIIIFIALIYLLFSKYNSLIIKKIIFSNIGLISFGFILFTCLFILLNNWYIDNMVINSPNIYKYDKKIRNEYKIFNFKSNNTLN